MAETLPEASHAPESRAPRPRAQQLGMDLQPRPLPPRLRHPHHPHHSRSLRPNHLHQPHQCTHTHLPQPRPPPHDHHHPTSQRLASSEDTPHPLQRRPQVPLPRRHHAAVPRRHFAQFSRPPGQAARAREGDVHGRFAGVLYRASGADYDDAGRCFRRAAYAEGGQGEW